MSPAMADRRQTRIVLGGLLALASACKDETSEPAAAGAAAAPSADGPQPNAPAEGETSPAEPPPSGHAVARVGSLLFFSSKGDVGFELPPVGVAPRAAPGMTVKVVGEADGRLVVETLVTEPAEHHCAATLDGLTDFRLRLYLAAIDLLPVLTEDFVHELGDGSKVRLARGVPIPAGSAELIVRGTNVRVPVPTEHLGRFYEPGQPLSSAGSRGKLYVLDGHPLTYGGRTLDESGLYREAEDVVHFGSTAKDRDALVTVRNPCVEVTALVSNERLLAAPPPGGSGGVLASPYGPGIQVGNDDEDVWGGLTGTSSPSYAVKAGVAITWVDGGPAGQAIADHRFTATPRNEGGRVCFDTALVVGEPTTVTLCFAPGDVAFPPGAGLGTLATGTEGEPESGTSGGFSSIGRRVPIVRQAKATVKGPLDKDIVRRIVRAHINEVRYCYNQGLSRNPSLKGRVTIQFSINPSGDVSAARVAESTVKDTTVSQCIVKAVKRWRFPKPPGGSNAAVTYPFVLEPG
jgi:TonB family protein